MSMNVGVIYGIRKTGLAKVIHGFSRAFDAEGQFPTKVYATLSSGQSLGDKTGNCERGYIE